MSFLFCWVFFTAIETGASFFDTTDSSFLTIFALAALILCTWRHPRQWYSRIFRLGCRGSDLIRTLQFTPIVNSVKHFMQNTFFICCGTSLSASRSTSSNSIMNPRDSSGDTSNDVRARSKKCWTLASHSSIFEFEWFIIFSVCLSTRQPICPET